MALALYDRVRETTTVLGTSDAVLLGAVTGYQSFSVVGSGNTCYYALTNGVDWEVGLGTYSGIGPTLARTTVYASSNAGAKVSFGAGTKDVFLTYPSEKAIQYDASGNLQLANTVTFTTTGAVVLPNGTTAEEPSPASVGMVRYNTTTNEFEGYSGASPAWKSIGGSALSNDTTTASYEYPVFAAATTGTAENLYTSNANYLYKPSTGELQANTMTANQGFFMNSNTITSNQTVSANYNAISAGPITVNSGVTVTVPSGSTWVVV